MPYNYQGYVNPYINNYNPYYQNGQAQRVPDQAVQYTRQPVLQGGIVTSIDEVKAINIPLDGSTSYYALADGSAIVTKQLQQDGKSKTIIYVPQEEGKQVESKYITENDLKAQFGEFNPKDIKDIKDEIKSLKKQIRDITDDIAEKRDAE